MFHYEAEVRFDDSIASVTDMEAYFGFKVKHCAAGIGHDKTGTSTLYFFSEEPLSVDQITEELGDLEVIAFEETEKVA